MYKKMEPKIITEVARIVGAKNLLVAKELLEDYSHDEFALPSLKSYPEVVARPDDPAQIAEIMVLANRENFPVVARGGGTGLCGGCVPVFGGVVLSLEKMNRILEIDPENLMVSLESGVTLKEFYTKLKEKSLFFPPHPGEESATVGGIIATNAGGARAVKYGTVRNFVREVEVVLPEGGIVHFGGKIIKDSSGYNLLHLMIGSEGTLGIITRATLSVMALPEATLTLIVPFENIFDALKSVPEILSAGILPLAIEFLSRPIIKITEDFLGKNWPVQKGEFYLLVILEGEEEELLRTSGRMADICLKYKVLDIFVAQNQKKQDEILNLRSMVYEALKPQTIEILDIVLPRSCMEPHLKAVEEISGKYNIWLPTYGHAGDGNLHTHIMKVDLERKPIENWEERYRMVRKEIHLDARNRGGKISGEHGIGLVKKEYLDIFMEKPVLKLMKDIKKLFDPNNILNPGKIL
ncbi:MAG: FAD-binding oxidoreductase [Candidatus Omnitrophota bacterium]